MSGIPLFQQSRCQGWPPKLPTHPLEKTVVKDWHPQNTEQVGDHEEVGTIGSHMPDIP